MITCSPLTKIVSVSKQESGVEFPCFPEKRSQALCVCERQSHTVVFKRELFDKTRDRLVDLAVFEVRQHRQGDSFWRCHANWHFTHRHLPFLSLNGSPRVMKVL